MSSPISVVSVFISSLERIERQEFPLTTRQWTRWMTCHLLFKAISAIQYAERKGILFRISWSHSPHPQLYPCPHQIAFTAHVHSILLLLLCCVPHSIAVIRSEIGLCSLSGYNTVLIRLIPWACPCPCVSIILYSLTKCRKLSTLIGEKQHHPTLSLCVPQSTACLPVYERGIITTGHPLDLLDMLQIPNCCRCCSSRDSDNGQFILIPKCFIMHQ